MKTVAPILLILAAVYALPVTTRADVPTAAQQHVEENFRKFDELSRIRRAAGSLPKLSDDKDAQVLNALWNRDAILGSSPFTSADIPVLLATLEKEVAVFKTYLLFSENPPALPRTDENTAVYQDELSRSLSFVVATSAAALEAMSDFIAKMKPGELNDARKQGLQQTRLGIQQFVSGAILMIRSPSLTSDNRLILATALQDNASTLASTLPLSDRRALAASALTVATPETRDALKAFVDAMRSKDCSGLCAIQ